MLQARINGVAIRNPDLFTIERFNLTKAGRVASGDMKMELIAKKRKFLLRYTTLSGTELQQLLSLIDTTAVFFTFEYREDNIERRATCYAGMIPSDRFRGGEVSSPEWHWRNINFDLIEV